MGEQCGHLEEETMVGKTNVLVVIFVLLHLPHSFSTPCSLVLVFISHLVAVQGKDSYEI